MYADVMMNVDYDARPMATTLTQLPFDQYQLILLGDNLLRVVKGQ